MKNICGEWCRGGRGAAPPPAGPEELAGAAAPPGPGPVKLAGAAAPPGAGPEFWPGRGAPPGQTPGPGRPWKILLIIYDFIAIYHCRLLDWDCS